VVVGNGAAVLADIPDRLDADQVEIAIVVLLVVCAIGAIVVLRTIQKAATRMLLLVVLLAVGVGLWWQREELEQCQGQCTCRVFGQDVNVPDAIAVNCPED
jgi:hypothetical protein